jgi:glycerophosphoryl diester phosphodiesterase
MPVFVARIAICLMLGLSGAAGQSGSPTAVRLIAHRGGVVDEHHPENSATSLKAAIQRGYWMVEVDGRESKDGHLVVQHDPDFQRFYRVNRKVRDMTWDEIRSLRSVPDDSRPLEFRELAALCRDRIRLMIDTKEYNHPPAFYAAMEEALRENGLLESTYIIGTRESKLWFKSKARVALRRDDLRRAIEKGEPVDKLYLLFERGQTLDAAAVALARDAKVPVVASINRYHYKGDDLPQAKADIERLLNLGIVYLQIDSIYDAL